MFNRFARLVAPLSCLVWTGISPKCSFCLDNIAIYIARYLIVYNKDI